MKTEGDREENTEWRQRDREEESSVLSLCVTKCNISKQYSHS